MRRPRARPNVGLVRGRHGAPPGTFAGPRREPADGRRAGPVLGNQGRPNSRIESAARAVTAAMERRKARVLARGLSAARRHPRRSANRRSVPFGLAEGGKEKTGSPGPQTTGAMTHAHYVTPGSDMTRLTKQKRISSR